LIELNLTQDFPAGLDRLWGVFGSVADHAFTLHYLQAAGLRRMRSDIR